MKKDIQIYGIGIKNKVKRLRRKSFNIPLFSLLFTLSVFSSCNKEPDESDLYTFTGQTIQEFVEADDNLSLFRRILERANLWAEMRTYGQYTCYAPSNEGVTAYVDSLWNDAKSTDDKGNLVHNGMRDSQIPYINDDVSLCRFVGNIERGCQ